jgi:hypothetical protein
MINLCHKKQHFSQKPFFGENISTIKTLIPGPGIKSIVRAKKQMKLKLEDENADAADNLKRKHVYRRRNKLRRPLTDSIVRNRNPSIDISPFLDMTVWRRFE